MYLNVYTVRWKIPKNYLTKSNKFSSNLTHGHPKTKHECRSDNTDGLVTRYSNFGRTCILNI